NGTWGYFRFEMPPKHPLPGYRWAPPGYGDRSGGYGPLNDPPYPGWAFEEIDEGQHPRHRRPEPDEVVVPNPRRVSPLDYAPAVPQVLRPSWCKTEQELRAEFERDRQRANALHALNQKLAEMDQKYVNECVNQRSLEIKKLQAEQQAELAVKQKAVDDAK